MKVTAEGSSRVHSKALEYSDVIADDSRAAPGHLIENLFARYANSVMPGTGSLLAREMPSFCMRK
jgi:hypothetical protein